MRRKQLGSLPAAADDDRKVHSKPGKGQGQPQRKDETGNIERGYEIAKAEIGRSLEIAKDDEFLFQEAKSLNLIKAQISFLQQ